MENAYETLLGLVRSRRSIRRFRPDPVDPELVVRLIEAARWAPSAGNRQAYRFIAVEDRERIAALGHAVEEEVRRLRAQLRPESRAQAEAYLRSFSVFVDAPLVLAPIHRAGPSLLEAVTEGARDDAGHRAEADSLCSVSAAVMTLLLAAHALGLGACWMTGPLVAEEKLRSVLGVPRGWSVSALVPLGYPAESPPPPPRRSAESLLRP